MSEMDGEPLRCEINVFTSSLATHYHLPRLLGAQHDRAAAVARRFSVRQRDSNPCHELLRLDLDEVVLALVRVVRVAVRQRGAKEVRRSTRRHMMRPYILELVACANFSLIGNGPGAVPALLREHPWRVNEILELA